MPNVNNEVVEPEDKPDEESPSDTTEDPQKPNKEGSEGENGDADNGSDEEGDDLPEWAREKLTKANSEAANYRTRLRAKEEELAEAVKKAETLEDLQAELARIQEESEAKDREITRRDVIRDFKLTDELAEFLAGEDEETLRANAEKLAKFLPKGKRPPNLDDLYGGMDPVDDDELFDPVKEAKKHLRRR